MAGPFVDNQTSVLETRYLGWRVFRLANGIVSLSVAPDIGGRVIQLQLGDHEFLFANCRLAGQIVPPALDPGEDFSFIVSWLPTSIRNPIRDIVWAGAINKPVCGVRQGQSIVLTGEFGVFTPGNATVVFYNAVGEEVAREVLQPVDPRAVFQLEKSVPLPRGAIRASVLVSDEDGENIGVLGNAILI